MKWNDSGGKLSDTVRDTARARICPIVNAGVSCIVIASSGTPSSTVRPFVTGTDGGGALIGETRGAAIGGGAATFVACRTAGGRGAAMIRGGGEGSITGLGGGTGWTAGNGGGGGSTGGGEGSGSCWGAGVKGIV